MPEKPPSARRTSISSPRPASRRSGRPPLVADDGVAALERRERRQRAQPRRRAIQCRRGGARRAAPTRAGAVAASETSRSRWRSTDRRAPRPRPARARSSDDVSSVEVGYDEPRRRGRRRCPDVRGEVAERRVLLVADRTHDRHRAPGHRADDTLVAERQQVLEAAAAAREDDDVDLGLRADRAQRLGDGRRRPRALHERLGDEQSRRREAGLDGDDDVSLGGGVVPGHEADPARDARQRPLALGREQPFRRQLLLEPLERGQVLAEAEALDRQRPQPQLALRLEQLRPPVHVHAFAVPQVEAQRVELPARHQPGDDRPVARVLEREEDALPALLPAQLADLALDPDRRQPLQPGADAAVERRDRVDPPVAVLDRLDLHRDES